MPEEAEDSLPPQQGSASPDDGTKAETLAERLDAKDRRIVELTDTLKRTQAEFENYKKRIERDWTERTKLAAERIVADLLAILDTLDKAEEAAKGHDGATQLDGIGNIRRQFVQTLQRAGLKEIDTSVSFDPFMHEALMREERDDEDEGTILEVFQKGYVMGGKVIRTAKVKVATGHDVRQPDPEPGDAENDNHNQHDDEGPDKEESK